jgi:hypothetical protein
VLVCARNDVCKLRPSKRMKGRELFKSHHTSNEGSQEQGSPPSHVPIIIIITVLSSLEMHRVPKFLGQERRETRARMRALLRSEKVGTWDGWGTYDDGIGRVGKDARNAQPQPSGGWLGTG